MFVFDDVLLVVRPYFRHVFLLVFDDLLDGHVAQGGGLLVVGLHPFAQVVGLVGVLGLSLLGILLLFILRVFSLHVVIRFLLVLVLLIFQFLIDSFVFFDVVLF